VSEAALYRHFASKAQMFEGLIEFIETTIFGLINDIAGRETSGLKQARSTVFDAAGVRADQPRHDSGADRRCAGHENERLQERMNQMFERIESSLKQSFPAGGDRKGTAGGLRRCRPRGLVVAYVIGRCTAFAKSGFRKPPADGVDAQLPVLLV